MKGKAVAPLSTQRQFGGGCTFDGCKYLFFRLIDGTLINHQFVGFGDGDLAFGSRPEDVTLHRLDASVINDLIIDISGSIGIEGKGAVTFQFDGSQEYRGKFHTIKIPGSHQAFDRILGAAGKLRDKNYDQDGFQDGMQMQFHEV